MDKSQDLERLYLHTLETINLKEISKVRENIKLFEDVYVLINDISQNPKKSLLYKEWERYINKIGEELVKVDLFEMASDMIISLYKIGNNYKKHFLDLEASIVALIRKVKYIDNNAKIHEMSIFIVLWEALLNADKYSGLFQGSFIPRLFSSYIYALEKNNYLSEDEKNDLLNDFLKETLYISYSTKVSQNTYRKSLLERAIKYILKVYIDLKDVKRLKKSIEVLIAREISSEINIKKIYLTILIYIYYLAFKENLSSEEKQKYLKLIKEIKMNFDILLDYQSNLHWGIYEEIKSELTSWELFPDEENSKWLMMDNVVREFFMFLAASSQDYKIFNLMEVKEEEIFSMINQLITNNAINNEVLGNYHKFKTVYGLDTYDELDDYELKSFAEKLLANYKQIRINKVLNIEGLYKKMDERRLLLKNQIENSVVNNNILSLIPRNSSIVKNKRTIYTNIYPIEFFIGHKTKNLFETIFQRIINALIINELKYYFRNSEINFNNTSNINLILSLIEDIEKNSKLNTILNGLSVNSRIFYNEDKREINRFEDYLKSVPKYQETNELILVGFDNKLNHSNIGEITLNIREPKTEEILDFLASKEEKNNRYGIKIVNDLILYFDYDEAISFIRTGYRILEIDLDIGFQFTMNTGIIIQPS
jgi:hypothetical protein